MTKFINTRYIILVTLCCATLVRLRCSTNSPQFVEQTLVLSCSFRCDQIHISHGHELGIALLCYLSTTYMFNKLASAPVFCTFVLLFTSGHTVACVLNVQQIRPSVLFIFSHWVTSCCVWIKWLKPYLHAKNFNCLTRGQFYKTFYGRKLRIFAIS